MDIKEAKAELKKKGITLQEFADRLGISRQGLNKRWANRVPHKDRLLILGIPESLQELFEQFAARNPEQVRMLLTSYDDLVIQARLQQMAAMRAKSEK